MRTHDKEKLCYLRSQGLVPGVGFRVLQRGPFNGPLRLLVDREEHVLGSELSAIIWVETLSGVVDPSLCNRAGCPLPKATGSHQYVR